MNGRSMKKSNPDKIKETLDVLDGREPVDQMAKRLSDAYSTGRYKGGWRDCIIMLRRHRIDDAQIEEIIRSKFTRWAADNAESALATEKDLERWLINNKTLQKL